MAYICCCSVKVDTERVYLSPFILPPESDYINATYIKVRYSFLLWFSLSARRGAVYTATVADEICALLKSSGVFIIVHKIFSDFLQAYI